MPRAGLTTAVVVTAAADLADEQGGEPVTFAALADRLGVRPPALYKHVDGIDDLRRRIATAAMTELGDALRDEMQGRAGPDAVAALFSVVQRYIAEHPGRYQATIGQPLGEVDDPLSEAASRVMRSVRAALSGYGLPPDQVDHAIRTVRCLLHGVAALQVVDGFQWPGTPADESRTWMLDFVDAGLTAMGARPG